MVLSYSKLAGFKARGKRVVLAHGTFDILHKSHIEWLNLAKSHGDILVVAVSPDSIVRKRKGKNRPINTLAERIIVVDSLKQVDFVVASLDIHNIQALNILDVATKLKPTLLFSSYTNFVTDYSKEVENIGLKVVLHPAIANGVSTSSIINRINERYNENTA